MFDDAPEGIKYYPFSRNWRKIRAHLEDPQFRARLERDFNKFTYGRWRQPFGPGQLPCEFECRDWRSSRRGRPAAYWDFVQSVGCHWLVNANLKLAELAEPEGAWRILTSHRHSTVWDGELTLFDMNFAAVGHPPEYAFVFACDRELKPGRQIRVGIPPYFEIAPRDGRPPLRHFAKTEIRSANSSTL